MSVRDNIRKLRSLTGITQVQLAEIADVGRSAVSLWEIGKSEPRMGAVQLIADHFGIRKSNIIEDGGMDNMVKTVSGRLREISGDVMELTSEESELLDLFRSANEQGRHTIMVVARAQSGMDGEVPRSHGQAV